CECGWLVGERLFVPRVQEEETLPDFVGVHRSLEDVHHWIDSKTPLQVIHSSKRGGQVDTLCRAPITTQRLRRRVVWADFDCSRANEHGTRSEVLPHLRPCEAARLVR